MASPEPPLYLDGRIATIEDSSATNAIVVDVRPPAEYEEGHDVIILDS